MLMTKEVLSEFSELIREKKCNPFSGMLKTGVDLGTANIVIAVTDENNHPVAGATAVSKVVKDGIVVDFVGAMQTVRRLNCGNDRQNHHRAHPGRLHGIAAGIPPAPHRRTIPRQTGIKKGRNGILRFLTDTLCSLPQTNRPEQ